MKYNPDIHNRQSIRLREYDYSQPGAYFVTICIYHKQCLLGEIKDQTVILNCYGEVVKFNWFNLTRVYPSIELDSFVIMPNHIHGIIILTDHSHTLSKVVQGFKTFSSRRINQLRSLSKVPVWQRGYYEHIIRDENALQKIREYIVNNPYNWNQDEMHPSHQFPISQNITTPLGRASAVNETSPPEF